MLTFVAVALMYLAASPGGRDAGSSDALESDRVGSAPYLVSAFEHAALLIRNDSEEMDLDTRVALLDAALEHPGFVTDEELNRFARSTLHSLLAEGYSLYSGKLWKRLPQAMRVELLAGSDAGTTSPHGDFRIPLALALLAIGDRDGAREVRLHLAPDAGVAPSHSYDPFGGERGRRLGLAILDWHLGIARPADTFDIVESYFSSQHEQGVPAALLVPIAGDRYGAALHSRWSWSLSAPPRAHRSGEDLFLPDGGMRTRLSSNYEDLLDDAKVQEFRALEEAAKKLPPVSDEDTPEVVELSVDAGTTAPIWTEKKLPPGVTPHVCQDGCEGDESRSKPALPDGFWTVRTEKVGTRVMSIALSQKVDPTGEVSGGGYWLFISDDGKAWRPGIYTGLQHLRPYVITAKSGLPMASKDGKRVTLEVNIRQIDENHIMFPPIALSTTREATGLFVEAELSTLQRDADSDGLSDILEQRMLIDPKNKDSDGDGIADGADAMPNVKASSRRTVDAELLQAFFERESKHAEAIMTGALDRKGDKPLPMSGAKLKPQDGVTYLSAGKLDLRGLDAPERLIVLDEAQLHAAVAKFGKFYPMSFRVVLRSADGKKVFIEWSESWRGGTLHGELRDGKWVLTDLGEWIT